ncbi:hypothetical protein cypCar_00000042 [Cyprinus carpio]|nr:hypothetical protein cypCar_00000042 [Cyprinus carpio]
MTSHQPRPFVMAHTSNEWSSGICDFCQNVPECCFAFWCFPCFACATSRKHGECLCLPLLDGFGCIPPITMAMRVSMRSRYGIQLLCENYCKMCLITKACCISIFWFPFMACTTAKRYGECFCLPLIDEFGLMRVSMRHRYGIEGGLTLSDISLLA